MMDQQPRSPRARRRHHRKATSLHCREAAPGTFSLRRAIICSALHSAWELTNSLATLLQLGVQAKEIGELIVAARWN